MDLPIDTIDTVDEYKLGELIRSARRRLVVIAPAVTLEVAEAIRDS